MLVSLLKSELFGNQLLISSSLAPKKQVFTAQRGFGLTVAVGVQLIMQHGRGSQKQLLRCVGYYSLATVIEVLIIYQLYGRWQSTVYLCYVEAADKDRREFEEMREVGEKDPIRENMDIYGHFV
jgi:hypothetical protein